MTGTAVWGDWTLTPEGAAVHSEGPTAVIADVHLGYEWARSAGGDCLPSHTLRETLDRLERLLNRIPFRRLIVAGDLVESPWPCPRTEADLRRLRACLEERSIEFLPLTGNHDGPLRGWPRTTQVGDWTVAHGDRPVKANALILGHHHPAFLAEGHRFPCFVTGPTILVLPAFSANAAGVDAAHIVSALPEDHRFGGLRRFVSSGEEVLDFGLIPDPVSAPPD